jgi:hypothetical protein
MEQHIIYREEKAEGSSKFEKVKKGEKGDGIIFRIYILSSHVRLI